MVILFSVAHTGSINIMRVTQRKGDIALAKAISTFTEYGYDVSLPITESAAYDLIVDLEGNLYRVQVKYSSGKEVDLRRIHSNSKGYVVKKYAELSYDLLYVLRGDSKEFIVSDINHNQSTITPGDRHEAVIYLGKGVRVV